MVPQDVPPSQRPVPEPLPQQEDHFYLRQAQEEADATGVHPEVLPAEVRPTVCTPQNPCPDRPRYFLGRWLDRPWRCPQCGRWWVTQRGKIRDGAGPWMWIRAEEKR